MGIAHKYGMLHPVESSTKAVRAVFFINPKGIIRNFDELKRGLIAMQTADTYNIATPADWRPGDDVIVATPGSCGVAKERMDNKEEMTCYDWFFCTKPLHIEKVKTA